MSLPSYIPKNKNNDKTAKGTPEHPFQAEFIVSLVFIFVLGFISVQKISQTPFPAAKQTLCDSGVSLKFIDCQSNNASKQKHSLTNTDLKPIKKVKESLIVGMDQSTDAKSLRTQFAYASNLPSALSKLKWNGGDEQDAARYLSVMTAIENGRSESSGIPSSMSGILEDIWNKYPDLVATSHCLNCNRFYQHVLEPYFNAGTKTIDRLNQIASGHPRFLQAIYKSGQLNIEDVQTMAKLQAELLSSQDAATARFIGDILLKDNDLKALHHWSSKGWNGSYALSDYHKLLKLPENIIVDAWERGVVKGADNAEITRYLVSTGYRPALRWLLWVHAGNLKYFKNTRYQAQKDTYNDLILTLHTDFPNDSKDDLAGFYSKHWENISWNAVTEKWTYIKAN